MNIRKKVIGVGTALAMLGGAGAAYAWYSSTGSGTGSATVASSSPIELSSPPVSGLAPGGADVVVPVTIHNPGGGAELVNSVSGSFVTQGECDGSWFQVDTYAYGVVVPGGATQTPINVHVRMINAGTYQDACQGKTLTINWTSN